MKAAVRERRTGTWGAGSVVVGGGLLGVQVAHACNSRTQEAEFKASLVYRVSFRRARATQRNPVSGKKKKKNSCLVFTRPWV